MAPMRRWSRDEIVTGLQAGKVLNIVRRDDPNIPLIMQLAQDDIVTYEIVQIDDQSSVMKVCGVIRGETT